MFKMKKNKKKEIEGANEGTDTCSASEMKEKKKIKWANEGTDTCKVSQRHKFGYTRINSPLRDEARTPFDMARKQLNKRAGFFEWVDFNRGHKGGDGIMNDDISIIYPLSCIAFDSKEEKEEYKEQLGMKVQIEFLRAIKKWNESPSYRGVHVEVNNDTKYVETFSWKNRWDYPNEIEYSLAIIFTYTEKNNDFVKKALIV